MKKIIIPFDGNHFSTGAFSFAKNLHEKSPILLTGVFLPSVDYARFFFFPSAFSAPMYMPTIEHFEEEDVAGNVEQFTELCEKNYMEYRVHKDSYGYLIPQLSTETRFADAMIIGSESFYKDGVQYGTDQYIKEALRNTECPVIIVPEEYSFPSQIILAYDGSESSVFAIKQFAYLFPELCNLKTVLVYVGNEKHDVPEQILIEELGARHYPDFTITKLTMKHKEEFSEWYDQHSHSIIVSGSFGRSGISELFSKSFVMDTIRDYATPVFIAHK